MVNALLLRSLPFRDPGLLAWPSPREFIPPHDTAGEFEDRRARSTHLSSAALVEEADVNLGGLQGSTRAHAAQISWNFFSTPLRDCLYY